MYNYQLEQKNKIVGKAFSVALLFLVLNVTVLAQTAETIKIWPDKPLYSLTATDHERVESSNDGASIYYYDITFPSFEYFKPEKANGAAIIVCPGGGYTRLAYANEGKGVGKWFAEHGIAAFVLRYRLPNDSLQEHKELVPLADAQQAIYFLRKNSSKYGIDANRIGIIGFSAGGHFASTLSTHFEKSIIPNEEKINLRPDYSILLYPVISMKENIAHAGSKKNLLGDNPSDSLVNEFSNETKITANTSPTFILHAADDKSVNCENSILYMEALKKNNVSVSFHLFPSGGHGFAMKKKNIDDQWQFLLEQWLHEIKIIP
jgi:acetyl esterase/lipase